MENINWLAQGVASLIPLLVGFVWYHEKVFGATWRGMLGMSEDDLKKGNILVIFGLTLVFSFFLSMVLFVFTNTGANHEGKPEFHTFQHGMVHGVIQALFVALPLIGINALFERKSWKYIALNVGYWVVTFALMGGVISVWR